MCLFALMFIQHCNAPRGMNFFLTIIFVDKLMSALRLSEHAGCCVSKQNLFCANFLLPWDRI